MPVYVDPLFDSEGMSASWPYKQACHCWADGEGTPSGNMIEELHDFCLNKLRMRVEWFQNKPFFPHYDLTARRRKDAVKLGAIEVSDTAAVEFRRVNKSKHCGIPLHHWTCTCNGSGGDR